ncbi:hypothetical protein ThrDRAFT_04783, partial [Frankia casuarinae]
MTHTETPTSSAEAPPFPQARTCPYAPPEGVLRLAEQGPLNRVRLYDGREVWLVSGYSQARTLLSVGVLHAFVGPQLELISGV